MQTCSRHVMWMCCVVLRMRGEAGGARGKAGVRTSGSNYPPISAAYWLPPSNPTPYHVPGSEIPPFITCIVVLLPSDRLYARLDHPWHQVFLWMTIDDATVLQFLRVVWFFFPIWNGKRVWHWPICRLKNNTSPLTQDIITPWKLSDILYFLIFFISVLFRENWNGRLLIRFVYYLKLIFLF